MYKTYRFIISGKVQGVWYRKTIYDNALTMGIAGTVRNLPNGDVEVVANLKDGQKGAFITMLEKGSLFSKVTNIKKEIIDDKTFTTFDIIYEVY